MEVGVPREEIASSARYTPPHAMQMAEAIPSVPEGPLRASGSVGLLHRGEHYSSEEEPLKTYMSGGMPGRRELSGFPSGSPPKHLLNAPRSSQWQRSKLQPK